MGNPMCKEKAAGYYSSKPPKEGRAEAETLH